MGRGVSVIAPWEMGTRMVGIVACGVVLPGKRLMSLLRPALQMAGQMANVRAQAGLEENSGIVKILTENCCIRVDGW